MARGWFGFMPVRLKASPGERLLRSALNHFDRIMAQGEFQSLMQQEMMRMHQGEASAMSSSSLT